MHEIHFVDWAVRREGPHQRFPIKAGEPRVASDLRGAPSAEPLVRVHLCSKCVPSGAPSIWSTSQLKIIGALQWTTAPFAHTVGNGILTLFISAMQPQSMQATWRKKRTIELMCCTRCAANLA